VHIVFFEIVPELAVNELLPVAAEGQELPLGFAELYALAVGVTDVPFAKVFVKPDGYGSVKPALLKFEPLTLTNLMTMLVVPLTAIVVEEKLFEI
jgi:hypothetical protein